MSPASVEELDADVGRAGVEGVLDELLDDRDRPLDDLPGRDLPRKLGRQTRIFCMSFSLCPEHIHDIHAIRPRGKTFGPMRPTRPPSSGF